MYERFGGKESAPKAKKGGRKRAQFGRYSYMEKAEYWALIWGSAVMIVTGFMLWAATQTIGLFGKLGFDIARVVHGYEAILASLALIVWHFYYVIYNPDDFVFKNLTWIHGNISRERMHLEHPLELEKIEKKRQSKLFRPD
jgi:cytochrome b subunit of formate dehydrogenase